MSWEIKEIFSIKRNGRDKRKQLLQSNFFKSFFWVELADALASKTGYKDAEMIKRSDVLCWKLEFNMLHGGSWGGYFPKHCTTDKELRFRMKCQQHGSESVEGII